jgi:hypothetical protein
MTFDPQAIFANLAEKERLKGHHSPEGQAIRMLSRALNGWSTATLSGQDVLVLSHQAVEDWLKSRLKLSNWSRRNLPELIAAALEKDLLTPVEAMRLRRIHGARLRDGREPSARRVNSMLEFCIRLVEKRW